MTGKIDDVFQVKITEDLGKQINTKLIKCEPCSLIIEETTRTVWFSNKDGSLFRFS
jgi:hypothetical protein